MIIKYSGNNKIEMDISDYNHLKYCEYQYKEIKIVSFSFGLIAGIFLSYLVFLLYTLL